MEAQPELPLRGGWGCGAVRFEVSARWNRRLTLNP
jgi:hypothetical protein